LGAIFDIIDSQKASKEKLVGKSKSFLTLIGMVTDVGVSQTTLEEVFMAVISEN